MDDGLVVLVVVMRVEGDRDPAQQAGARIEIGGTHSTLGAEGEQIDVVGLARDRVDRRSSGGGESRVKSVERSPAARGTPARRLHRGITADGEQVKAVGTPRDCADGGRADESVVDSEEGAPAACVGPVGGVDRSVGAGHEDVEIGRAAGDGGGRRPRFHEPGVEREKRSPAGRFVPVRGMDSAVRAGDEEVEVTGAACNHRDLGARKFEAGIDCEPRAPSTNAVPIARIDPAVGAGDEQIEVVRIARDDRDR